jgi:TonB-linked SusC/RagA family outer membrane protein
MPRTPEVITGKVVDVNGQPMAGVNVIVKGTLVGTATNADGEFSIEASPTDVLVFSFIGYATVEEPLNSRLIVNITLVEDIKSLREVTVNAGYYLTTKKMQTGSISKVTAESLEKQPVPNVLMAIQGRMPGVVITQASGIPGTGMKVQIRGQNSLRSRLVGDEIDGNYPLYVIDGVPVASNPTFSSGWLLSELGGGIDPLNLLNPGNIESIEILKDADATAIYGSRGANGVVLITTKKGKSGATDIDVQVYRGAGRVSKMMDVMNTAQYLAMREEAFANDGAMPGPSDYDVNGTWDQTTDTDWQDELIGGTAPILDVQASMSGGSENTSFRFGGGFHQEGTVFPGDFGYQKATGFLNLNHTTADGKLKLSLSINYGKDRHNLFNANITAYAVTLPPNAPSYDDNGNLDWTGYGGIDNANPWSYFETSHTSEVENIVSNASISFEILQDLKIITSLGFNNSFNDQVIKRPQSSLNPTIPSPSNSSIAQFSGTNWIVEPQITYTRQIAGGVLDILVGGTWQSNSNTSLDISGEGYASDALLGNIQAAARVLINDDSESEYRYNAVFGRIGYVWKDRYLLNLTARRDGSSRFGPDRQFGNFGAIGLAWIFSEEKFIRQARPLLSFGKLRGSYGTTGSDQIGNYGYASTYSASSTSYRGQPILNTTALANPDFAWEVNKKLEAAIELGFLKNRLELSASWYRNRSSNQLVGYPLPSTTGFSTIQHNLDATVENTGWEFGVTSINLDAGDITWTTSFNLTFPRNKLISYPNIDESPYASRYVVGKSLNISRKYKYLGVDPETGLYQIKDIDQNGSYNLSDRQIIFDYTRRYYGGLHSTLRYGPVDVSLSVEFVNQKSSDYLSTFHVQPGRMGNQLSSILMKDRWMNDGDIAEIQKFTQISSSNYSRAAASDLSVTDASFVRMRAVSVSYTLPPAILKGLNLQAFRVYLQAQNLFTITDYFGLNPEYQALELPPLRVIGGGVQIKF